MKIRGKELGIFLIIVALIILSRLKNDKVLVPDNLENTGRLIGMYGIFSIGMGLVIITRGIDLSVGSEFALFGVIMAIALTQWHLNAILVVLGILALGGLLGWGHGALITRVRLQPFLVTLCGLLLYRGLARYIAGDETKGFGDAAGFGWLKNLSLGSIEGVPIPLIILAVLSIVMYFALERSVWGRYLYAVGRNEEAARYAGINARAIVTSSYVLCGILAGLASIQFAFYTNSISPSSHGTFYELYAIAAAVLGGCSLMGGEGTILGIILGTTLLQVLRNLVNLLHIPSSLEFAVMGVVILVGVLVDHLMRRKA